MLDQDRSGCLRWRFRDCRMPSGPRCCRERTAQGGHKDGGRRCAYLFCMPIESPRVSGHAARQDVVTLRSRGHKIDDCDLYAESLIRSWVSRSECNTIRRDQPGANRGLCRSSIGGGSSGPRLSGMERGVSRDPEGFLRPGLHSRGSFKIGPDGAPVPDLKKLRKLAAVSLTAPVE